MKKVLLVEDEPDMRSSIQSILKPYVQYLEVVEATNAGEAMDLLSWASPDERPDALILDLMMPYGEAAQELDYANSDSSQVETGIRILKKLREKEKSGEYRYGSQPLWVSVITARGNPNVIQRLGELLVNRGRIYLKPFSRREFVHDLALVLGIESQVDPDFLPPGYSPPMQADGGAK